MGGGKESVLTFKAKLNNTVLLGNFQSHIKRGSYEKEASITKTLHGSSVLYDFVKVPF